MELTLLKGPLESSWMDAIVRLYGPFNHKYADRGFCELLFDHNPHGYSLHAFLLEGGETVGHYAVIPMAITVDGERRMSGKGEAFVVHPDHRRATVRVGTRDVLCGPAMQLELMRMALASGLPLLHMIASPEVAPIHRMTGCRALGIRHRRARLTLATGSDRGEPPWARATRKALGTAQRLASRTVASVVAPDAARVRRWSGAQLDDRLLRRIATDVPSARGWTLAVEPASLGWLARAGALELVALDERLQDQALLCPRAGDGRMMEVVWWRQRSPGLRPAVRLLAAVVESATRSGDLVVAFSDTAAWDLAEQERLRAAGRTLWFRDAVQDAGLWVRTHDPTFLDPARVHFTPFFYAIY